MNFVRLNATKVINLEHVTSIVFHDEQTFGDEDTGAMTTLPASVEITMTSTSMVEVTKYDGEVIGGASESDMILLTGKEATEFWLFVKIYCTKEG